MYVVASELA
ncbi:hypothetical protein H4920_003786 [Salmonella enterica]|uniref:Uncharacterized protein n=6 Tax=Salmonella enterica TaxID=28901 RepID=A0A3V1CPN7_SALET|nr:hypothetical protein [Salmonella enterica subsp. enterica serovar Typhimurium]EAA5108655.1 hypothetical protein [Salmonella enterica subsp. enterica]EAA5825226.1 hypothetical protein [Salmonella enterica]EAA7417755.1 hypothetical protein [Salmonella enterica subsp. enterica serovar Heidelberg]EAA7975364.1 hypothetical protein [Salmonella enterica subsp. enterica serovar 4,[5],12:i:-]EAU2860379.1 hypothetical protein [Salmonella enterica subsp. enterica serovar 4,12:i:-]EBH8050881.1 hypothe